MMFRLPAKILQFLFVGSLLGVCSPAARAAATFTPLTDLPGGGFYSYANAISANGAVVVGQSSSANGLEAFRWTADGGIVGLGDLPGGVFESSASGVSADGSVVVGSGNMTSVGSGTEAFRWTSQGGMVGLGDLPGGLFVSGAAGVSADGSVVVGYSIGSSGNRPIRWTAAGGMMALTDSPKIDGASVSAISADASVVAGTFFPPGQAFRLTEAGGMVPLVGPPDSVQSGAWGISADGSAIVGDVSKHSPKGDGSTIWEAYRWTAASGMVRLGVLSPHDQSLAFAASADGSVVVGGCYGSDDDPYSSFYWTKSLGMVNLRDLLISQGAANLAGWNLDSATGVSADGRTIAGYGTNPAGNQEAWVARLDASGDFDLDGDVDGDDFLTWQRHAGGPGNLSQGDANGDAQVTEADLTIWKSGFATDANAAATAAVPESTATTMILTAGLALAMKVMRLRQPAWAITRRAALRRHKA